MKELIKRLGGFVRLIFRVRAGWVYVRFAQIGLALIALGIGMLTPGFWDFLFYVTSILTDGQAESTQGQFDPELTKWVTISVIVSGTVLIFLALWLFATKESKGPDEEGIAVQVQPSTQFEDLVLLVAESAELTINFDALAREFRKATVSAGLLEAEDFESFLRKAATRSSPGFEPKWESNDNFYRMHV